MTKLGSDISEDDVANVVANVNSHKNFKSLCSTSFKSVLSANYILVTMVIYNISHIDHSIDYICLVH